MALRVFSLGRRAIIIMYVTTTGVTNTIPFAKGIITLKSDTPPVPKTSLYIIVKAFLSFHPSFLKNE